MLTFAPTATGEGGNIGTVVEDEDVEEEDKGRSTGTRAKSGDTSTDGEDDDTDDGDSEEDDDDDDDDDDDEDEDESESREDGAIQAIKKPKFVGVPRPVSIRHAGLIPKARSGSNDRRGCNPRRALLRTIALSMVATWSLS
ncbi:hypothetical protein BGX28_009614 [Mortierella sp. GBA30]|nr:hypothetical protein BGX28_009614 [Mortierella sp. GBA30]